MGAGTATDGWLLQSFRTEWASLRVNPLNVLLEGSRRATDAALSILQLPMCDSIVWSPTSAFDLPGRDVSTLILKKVAGLRTADQTRLLAWIDRNGSGTQIISTSEHPLFAAVASGVFDEALYYRLNVILLRIEPRNASA